MTNVRVTFAGLTALLQQSSPARAMAVLVNHRQHKHEPLLVVREDAIAANDGLPQLPAATLKRLLKKTEIKNRPGYVGFALDGTEVLVANASDGPALTSAPREVDRPCPGNDWSSLGWMIHVGGDESLVYAVDVNQLKASPRVSVTVPINVGHLKGRRPFETRNFGIKTYRYGDRSPQAYTDAFSWDVQAPGPVRIEVRSARGTGALELGSNTELFIINLPDPGHGALSAGEHLDAFEELPLTPPVSIAELDEAEKCADTTSSIAASGLGPANAHVQHGHRTSSDGFEFVIRVSSPISVPISLRLDVRPHGDTPADDEPSHDVAAPIVPPGLRPFGPLGDGNCMNGRFDVTGL